MPATHSLVLGAIALSIQGMMHHGTVQLTHPTLGKQMPITMPHVGLAKSMCFSTMVLSFGLGLFWNMTSGLTGREVEL